MDTSDPSTHKQADLKHMGSTGLKAVLNILEKWGCSAEQSMAILRLPKATFYKPSRARLDRDQLTRLSYLLNMHQTLRIVLENPENVYGFMNKQNHNPYFHGHTPLEVIESGDLAALHETHKRIETLQGVSGNGAGLPVTSLSHQKAYRLINSKLPTINRFGDAASAEDFEDLCELQALINSRLSSKIGNLHYLDIEGALWAGLYLFKLKHSRCDHSAVAQWNIRPG